MTEFNFPFFANSRILEVEAQSIHGLLSEAENIKIEPRPKRK